MDNPIKMKRLSSIKGDLFHRHFGEDTFTEFKSISEISELYIVTYSSIRALESTISFIFRNFVEKSNKATIVVGIKGINHDNATKKFEKAIKFIESLSHPNLTIYLHTRCHIKLISADNLLYLGTQNVSGTSNSFLENSEKNFTEVFNDHEIIVRIDENGRSTADKIVDELKSDTHSCFCILRNTEIADTSLAEIRHSYSHEIINRHFESIKTHASNFTEIERQIDTDFYDPDEEHPQDIINLLSSINLSVSRKQHNKHLRELLQLAISEEDLDYLFSDYKNSIYSAIDDMRDDAIPISKSVNYQKAILCLEEADIEKIDFGASYFNELIDSIKEEIHFAGVTDIPTYLEHMRHHIVSQLNSNQGQYDLHKVIDDEGFASFESIEAGILDNEISRADQLDTLRTELSSFVNNIAKMIISALIEFIKIKLDEAYNAMLACIDEVKANLSRLEAT
ncbi:hypothetical protein SAMN04487880_3450 [Marinobacter sp. es.042]|uniref:hypothetical protein n=1 Tax=Marinobacter sp. es.042 TaxID=1761794 RepID=UPI000B51310D|nr:hypothetical protein [Marinobacter sp. es.042]SNB59172.1 hypothetical protein SAMN04487880_3450 [Marinobacter sp. es.042]